MKETDALAEMFADVGARVYFDEPMARLTTWRIGGPADILVEPVDVEQVRATVSLAKRMNLPVFTVGRGSNLLVRDGGVRGIVIHLGDGFSRLEISGDRLRVQAGRAVMSAAFIAMRQGLSGLEFATLIPGSVGGAVTMNAGAHGGEIKDVLSTVTVLTQSHEVLTMPASELSFAYRHSKVPECGWIVLEAEFQLVPGDPDQMQEKVRSWGRKRQQTQPLSYPNCGSVFRNPPGDHAARLVEAAGLKGARVGQAAISELHANFIVNLGDARATDVLALIQRAKDTVEAQFGVRLQTEVRVVGEDETRR